MGASAPPPDGVSVPPARAWDLVALEDPGAIDRLRGELGIPRAGAEILARRGLADPETAAAWLDLDLDRLHDPFLLPDCEAAARRLLSAIERKERIVVHGDYDADGISGTALLCDGLRRLGAEVEPFVPHRERDGYGVALRLVEHAGSAGVKVLVTVDTGSSAHEALARAAELGIEVIVCDHHLFDRRPEGVRYFVNPHRDDSEYPHRDLCGCAVAFKLMHAILRLRGLEAEIARQLDLVALGVLADQMPLTGENRVLVGLGLRAMEQTPRPGLRALLQVGGLRGQRLEAEDVAFQVAPRINAPGRIERALSALELLLEPDPAKARTRAAHLDALNRRRRQMDRELSEQATEAAATRLAESPAAGLVLASADWHQGVVGIGAARVVRRFRLPTVLLAIDGEEAVGSARSVPGLDLKVALDGCADLLTRYGGHAAAAGMALPTARIDEFAARFDEVVAATPRRALTSALTLDAELGLEEIDLPLAEFLQRLGPFGQGHAPPRFASFGLGSRQAPQVVGGRHLRLRLGRGGRMRSFIGFSMAEQWLEPVSAWPAVDVVYSIRYRQGSQYDPWELILEDLRAGGQGIAGEAHGA